jgi:hypothetical protein
MVDYCVPEDRILCYITWVSIENKLPQPFLMRAECNFSEGWKRTNASPKQNAEVKELERGVVYSDPENFISTKRIGQWL